MIPLVCATGFVGYLLVYAAVADGGRYSARPWDALFASTPGAATPPGGAKAGGGGHSVLGRILSIGGKLDFLLPGGLIP